MKTPTRIFLTLLIVSGIQCSTGIARGEDKGIGLSVEPGWLLIRDVPIGQLYEMENRTGIRFKINNNSDTPRRFMLKVDEPAKVGVKVLKGYTGIPDRAWFWFEKEEALILAHDTVEIRMFLRIPDEEKYYNQKWAVGIDVEGKPESGEGLVLAVSPVFYIETESRAVLKEKPAGFLGVTPGTIVFSNAVLGTRNASATIVVYNNDDQPHSYTIRSFVPSAEPGKQVITPTPGLFWIPEKDWLKPSISVLIIAPDKCETISLDLVIPEKAYFPNQHLEGIIVVESEEGLADFTRVQIITSEQ